VKKPVSKFAFQINLQRYIEAWGEELRAADAPRPILEDPRSPSVSSVSSSDSSDYDNEV
jgi:hypothetical protein